jgi:hypothetical protein
MPDAASDTISRVLGELLRAPEPMPDIEVARALQRLQAARSDAPHLLLHRVLVLETALQQLQRARSAAQAPAAVAAAAPGRSFLQDAAVVALGVAAGQAVADSLGGDGDNSLGSMLGDGGLGDLLG